MSTRRFGVFSADRAMEYEDKQRQVTRGGGYPIIPPEGIQFYKFPTDKDFVRLDILPFVVKTVNADVLASRYEYQLHRHIGPSDGTIVCPRLRKQRCPICDYIQTLKWGGGDTPEDQTRKALKAQDRQLYAVIPLDGADDVRGKLHILDVSKWGFGRMLDDKIVKRDMSDPQEIGWDKYADLLEGYSLKLTLAELPMAGRSYRGVTSIDFKTRLQQYDESWYDRVPDLSECCHYLEYEEIQKMFGAADDVSAAAQVTPIAKPAESFDLTEGYNPLVTSATVDKNRVDDDDEDDPF